MAPIAEINTTTAVTTNDHFDSASEEYFRLYEADAGTNDDGLTLSSIGDGSISYELNNLIVGAWNSFDSSNTTPNYETNVTAISSSGMVNKSELVGSANGTTKSIHIYTSIGLGTDLDVHSSSSSVFDDGYSTVLTTNTLNTNGNGIANTDGAYSFDDNNESTTISAFDAYSTAPSKFFDANFTTTESNNYVAGEGEDDINFALIDSAEVSLGVDTDYETINGFNGGGESIGGVTGLNVDGRHSSAFDSFGASKNESYYSSYSDGGGTTMMSTVESGVGVAGKDKSGSTFMMLLEDFGDYFYNYNGSGGASVNDGGVAIGIDVGVSDSIGVSVTDTQTIISSFNVTDLIIRTNCSNITDLCIVPNDEVTSSLNYWALPLMVFPLLTLFGNILVILAVFRERTLQSVTNYFIVSLAIADLLVALVVMPFAVYVLVNNGSWDLPESLCDFYIGMDVSCSTSSIMNLVAISRDRYIAVTQPIKYAKYKNTRRVCLTILAAWASSISIGAPIMVGINDTPDRVPNVCAFYNTYYILVSSLVSFYIPCLLMGYLYSSIFKALRDRARKQHHALRKPHLSELTGGSVIENVAQTTRLAETALDGGRHAARIIPDEPATNTASGSNEEEEDAGGGAISPDIDDCHVIVNDKSTEFMLATVVEETGNVVAQISSPPQLVVADPNGNHDSGYAPSNVDDVLTGTAADSSPPDSPEPSGTLKRSSVSSSRRNTTTGDSPTKREPALSVAMKPLSFVRYGVQEAMTLVRNDSTLSATSKTSSRKDKKGSQASRFTIYKVHKASKKKREKVSARKERKATKTLAIVLGVFLVCWLPFFTCNVMDAIGAIFKWDCRPGMTVFIFTTWLGYINSFINPVIYTIFNPEFRKAFKKIMHLG